MVDELARADGLRIAAWLSDDATERWGAVCLFESSEAADRPLPGRLLELIGKDPDLVDEFDLEAWVEGRFEIDELSRRGLAFET